MKVYVINFKKVRAVISLALTLIVATALTVGLIFVADAYVFPRSEQTVADAETKITTVILDAGHGGEDCGAVGENGVYEKDINLAIATCMKGMLEEKGYTVIMTRTEDKMLYSEAENVKGMRKLSDLKNRCKVAEGHDDAVFISIHVNSFGAPQYSGLQVYYSDGSAESRSLADSIQGHVRNSIQPSNNRAIKNGKDLYVLDKCPVTSVLVECGFLTNPEEAAKLSEKEYQKELSFSVVCGIIEYIEKNNT